MARHAKGSFRTGFSALLAPLLVAVGLVTLPIAAPPAEAAACPAGTVSPLHGENPHMDSGYLAGYVGYSITNVSTSSNLTVEPVFAGGAVSLAPSQPSSQSYQNVVTADVSRSYFLVQLDGSASSGATTTIDVIIKDGTTELCRYTDSMVVDGAYDTIGANANKITSASIAGAGQTVGPGSRTVVTLAGETGTIGSGPSSRPHSEEINFAPVAALGAFSAAAWELVRVEFRSDSASCNGGESILHRLHISSTTSPSSLNCGGTYKANFTFEARSNFVGSNSSTVQAFSYIASGTQIKHTDPYSTPLTLPTVDSNSTNVTTVVEPNLASYSGTLYTITFNGNTSDGGSVPPSLTSSGDVTLPGNTGSLTKSNSNFVGWGATAGATTALSSPYNLSANVTLYAIWAGSGFTLTFDGNGAQSGTVPSAITGGGPTALPGNTGGLGLPGNRFLGWASTNNATSALSSPYTLASNITLYAVWEPVFTITFDGNTEDSGTVPSPIVNAGTISLPGNTGTLVKGGNTFLGWATSPTATTALPASYNLSADVTLYAVWSPTFTITFDPNNADSGSAPSVITGAGTVTLPGNSGSLVRAGHQFLGWATSPNATAALASPYNLAGNITLYAVWEQQFTLAFDANGAATGSVPTAITGNGAISLPGNTGVLAKPGSTFLGWAATNTATVALPTQFALTTNQTLYAVWQAVVQNNPAPAPAVQSSDPCEPEVEIASATYVELGLAGVVLDLIGMTQELTHSAAMATYHSAMESDLFVAFALNQAALVNPARGAQGYQETMAKAADFFAFAKSTPKTLTKEDEILPTEVVVGPGSEPNSVSVSTSTGEPLELLSVQSIDLNLYAAFTGAQLNNPAVWQGIGYGMQCWKLEPFVDTWFYLPASAQPPGAPAGNWVFSNVIVKAGSITADPTTFQANTLFPAPKGGEMVWADVNGNGVYDPGGKGGDKAISHIVLCANLISASSPSPTSSPTPTSTPTVAPTSAPAPTPTASPEQTVTPTPTPTTSPTPTPSPTSTPTVTPSPTLTPAPIPSPEPTTAACSDPKVAPPSPAPTPTILIRILGTPEPTPSSSPTPTASPTASPSPTVTPAPTASPEPTVTPTPSASPTASPAPTASPEPTVSPTPTASPTASPSPSATPEPTASPAPTATPAPLPGPTERPEGPVPTPVFDPAPPTSCQPSPEFGVAMKLTNGLSTTCFRMTSASFFSIASFGGFEPIAESEDPTATGELADTGFDLSRWLVVAMLMLAAGSALLVYARRRA